MIKKGTDPEQDLTYRIWNGTNWSIEKYIDDPDPEKKTYEQIMMTSNKTPKSVQIGLMCVGHDKTAVSWIWDGNSWGNYNKICDASYHVTDESYECAAIAYEYTTGAFMTVAAHDKIIRWSRFNGSWSIVDEFMMGTEKVFWLVLKTNTYAGSNTMMLLSLDELKGVYARVWNGAKWSASMLLDNEAQTYEQRCMDGEWEPNGIRFVAVIGDNRGETISYKIWTPINGWTPLASNSWLTNTFNEKVNWVQVKMVDRTPGPLLQIAIQSENTLSVANWDGSSMIDLVAISNSTTKNYESYSLAESH